LIVNIISFYHSKLFKNLIIIINKSAYKIIKKKINNIKMTVSKNKKSSGKKQTKKVKEVVKVVEVETKVEDVVDKVVVDNNEDNYDNEFSEINEKLKNALLLIRELTTHVSKLEKRVVRDRKIMNKKMKKRVKRNVDPNKPPSGFAKPGPVSDELRKFLGLNKDELIARTEVTKKITEYCKKHDLQVEEDKRNINADKALKKLLRLQDDEKLTFFNLQKFMKIHYPSSVSVSTSA